MQLIGGPVIMKQYVGLYVYEALTGEYGSKLLRVHKEDDNAILAY